MYVSDAVWWTTSNSLMLTGSRIGEFRAQLGPSLPLREGTGFFAPPLFPPFRHSFQFELDAQPDTGRKPAKRASVERLAAQALSLAAPLRRLGEGLWIYLFVVVPLAIGSLGLIRTWAPLLALLALWLTAIVLTYRRSWRTLHEAHPSGWRSDAALMVRVAARRDSCGRSPDAQGVARRERDAGDERRRFAPRVLPHRQTGVLR